MGASSGARERAANAASASVTAEVHPVRDLLTRSLQIPEYQRPYKWQVHNVAQLVDDIDMFRSSGRYRLGTVILHRNERGDLDIVDGQQRFITFCLIAHYLSDRIDGSSSIPTPDLDLPARGDEISRENIVANYTYLRESLTGRSLDEWATFFLDDCDVVVLTLNEIDEAFQMFDSQNTRGKALYPTDLLKAFHIREMSSEHTTDHLKLEMVRLWEEIPPESIDELFAEYLFKIKLWANGRAVPITGFGTRHVDVFKGIRESDPRNAKNTWALPFLYAKNYTDDFRVENATLIRYGAMEAVGYPFQIDQPVTNGETFFMMVRHYYDLGLRCGLFRDDPAAGSVTPPPELAAVLDVLNPHHRKSTHRLVRNLFDCLVLYYLDRFSDQDLQRAIDLIVRYSMSLRVQQTQVRRAMINNYALGALNSKTLPDFNLFQVIREAMRTRDVLRRVLPNPELNGYEELRRFFPDGQAPS